MADTNRGVVYTGPGQVEVQDLDYPKLELAEQHRKLEHGVILRVVATNIWCAAALRLRRASSSDTRSQVK